MIIAHKCHDGTSAYLSTIAHDITQHKKVTEALRESEERFRLATEALGGLVYESDLLTGKVHRWSGLFQLLGYGRTEVPDDIEEVN